MQRSVITNNTAAASLSRLTRRQQTLLTSIKYESKSLVGHTQQPRGTRNAAVRSFERSLDQVTFVAQHLFFERTVERERFRWLAFCVSRACAGSSKRVALAHIRPDETEWHAC